MRHIVLLTILCTAGCKHMAIGTPPLDADLHNNGSPAAQSDIAKKYRVTYDRGAFRRPGASIADVERETNAQVDDVGALADSDDALNYLRTAPKAKELLETAPAITDRAVQQLGPGVAVAGALVAGLVVGAIAGPALIGGGAAPPPGGFGVNVTIGLGLGFGTVLAGPMLLLHSLVVSPTSRLVAGETYRDAADAFNADLHARIKQQSQSAGEPDDIPIKPKQQPAPPQPAPPDPTPSDPPADPTPRAEPET